MFVWTLVLMVARFLVTIVTGAVTTIETSLHCAATATASTQPQTQFCSNQLIFAVVVDKLFWFCAGLSVPETVSHI